MVVVDASVPCLREGRLDFCRSSGEMWGYDEQGQGTGDRCERRYTAVERWGVCT